MPLALLNNASADRTECKQSLRTTKFLSEVGKELHALKSSIYVFCVGYALLSSMLGTILSQRYELLK